MLCRAAAQMSCRTSCTRFACLRFCICCRTLLSSKSARGISWWMPPHTQRTYRCDPIAWTHTNNQCCKTSFAAPPTPCRIVRSSYNSPFSYDTSIHGTMGRSDLENLIHAVPVVRLIALPIKPPFRAAAYFCAEQTISSPSCEGLGTSGHLALRLSAGR